jgi:hypothetical protein
MNRSQTHSGTHGQAGFTFVAVLVITSLIATLAATYAHHVTASQHTSLASAQLLEARDASISAAEYARLALLNGQTVQSSLSSSDGSSTVLTVTSPSETERNILVETSHPSGLGATRLVQATFVPDPSSSPTGPNSLPTLSQATIDALIANTDVPKTFISSNTALSDVDLQGLYIVDDGVVLQLSNVVLNGAILSEDAYAGLGFGRFDSLQAPTIQIDGNVRIDSASYLPGVAILMPDGVLTTGYLDGRVQIEGDIVAHGIAIDRPGSVQGHIQSVNNPSLDPGLDRIWSERKPTTWSADLQFGNTWDPSSVAIVPSSPTSAEIAAIRDYWTNS